MAGVFLTPTSGGTLKSMNKINPTIHTKLHGFTIVELLIVIVVIAILAAISIAAYTNIQQRAKNTAIINAASQSLKMIEAYIAANGTYPVTWSACITVDSGCQISSSTDSIISSSSTFNTNMATIGVLPKSVPTEGSRLYGVTYVYSSSAIFNDKSQPARLQYYLFGINQQCGINGVVSVDDYTLTPSTMGYTHGNVGGGKTWCAISIPGPAHS